MVSVQISVGESGNTHKEIVRALKEFMRTGIGKQIKESEYHKTKAQKNRDKTSKVRQIRKRNRAIRNMKKHKFT